MITFELHIFSLILITAIAAGILWQAVAMTWLAHSYRRGLIILAGCYITRIKRHGPALNASEKVAFDLVNHIVHRD